VETTGVFIGVQDLRKRETSKFNISVALNEKAIDCSL
jgi:hypothetical protein